MLLAELLQPGSGPPVFRGAGPESRPPRPSGSILSIERGIALIDLGSLDGLAQGGELAVYIDATSSRPTGRVTLTAVFRERARGVITGTAQVGSRIRVAAPAYLNALLDQVSTLNRGGDSEAAEKVAEQAARLADTVPSAPPPQRAAAWNALAVFQLLHGRPESAEPPLRQVLAIAPGSDPAWARGANNLGVLLELRGDRSAAEDYYSRGLNTLNAIQNASASERQAIEANLSRVSASR